MQHIFRLLAAIKWSLAIAMTLVISFPETTQAQTAYQVQLVPESGLDELSRALLANILLPGEFVAASEERHAEFHRTDFAGGSVQVGFTNVVTFWIETRRDETGSLVHYLAVQVLYAAPAPQRYTARWNAQSFGDPITKSFSRSIEGRKDVRRVGQAFYFSDESGIVEGIAEETRSLAMVQVWGEDRSLIGLMIDPEIVRVHLASFPVE